MISAKKSIAWVVVDDSILFINDLTVKTSYTSIFDNPILKYYKQLHDSYGTVVLMAMFYTIGYDINTQTSTWDLSKATDRFKDEFEANSHWLKMSFHGWAGNVRYNAYRNDVTTDTDYSRDLIADLELLKSEVIRFGGESSWNWNTILHFVDAPKSAIDHFSPNWNLQISYPQETRDRGVTHYLDAKQQAEMHESGYYYDKTNGVLFCIRDFAFERINGVFKVAGTPNRAIDYLDYYNHRSKTFMNPETHEVQIANGPSKQFPTRRDMNDFCAWCYGRNYQWKFPTKSDFDIT